MTAVEVRKPHRGIPKAEFLEDVDTFFTSRNVTVQDALKDLEEQYQKYKLMESTLTQRKNRIKNQLPDILNTIQALGFLHDRQASGRGFDAHHLLSDQLYVECSVPATDHVYLWLGANVMLEYSLSEAEKVLADSLNQAQGTIKDLDEDLAFLQDQVTITEVSMARIYNFDVRQRQQQQQR